MNNVLLMELRWREKRGYFLMVNTGLNAWVHTAGFLPQLGWTKAAASPLPSAFAPRITRSDPHPAGRPRALFSHLSEALLGCGRFKGSAGPFASISWCWLCVRSSCHPLTVTNALFGSETQRYGSSGRFNANWGEGISCPPPRAG